ncbi:unnamed protein product, partial [Polarella glacialis]
SPSGSRPGTNSQLSSRPATSSATHSRPVTRDAVGFGEPDADGGLGISRQITADDKRLADSRPTSKGSAGPGVITALWSRDEEGGSTRSEVSPMFRSCRSLESVLSARSHGEWVKTAPPGDVFYRTLPGSWAQVSGIQDSEPGLRKKKKKRDTSPDGSPVAPAVQQDVDNDPFKDWKRNVMDVGNMSLFQWNLTTLEGMSSIQKDFKDERASFKHWFHALEAEAEDPSMRLTDDRI